MQAKKRKDLIRRFAHLANFEQTVKSNIASCYHWSAFGSALLNPESSPGVFSALEFDCDQTPAFVCGGFLFVWVACMRESELKLHEAIIAHANIDRGAI